MRESRKTEGKKMEKKLGIIGGMGPQATCSLLETIIKFTDASKDQEHIHIILENDSKIPDRSEAILSGGADPTPELIACGRRLIDAGAELLVMHCNTAHYFYDAVAREMTVSVFHMLRETAQSIAQAGIKRVGMLTTTGTKKSGVYDAALAEYGIEPVYPEDAEQELLMSQIYDYAKGGRGELDASGIRSIIAHLKGAGAEKLVIGCTEVPILLRGLSEYADADEFELELGFADPTLITAKKLIELAGYRVKSIK